MIYWLANICWLLALHCTSVCCYGTITLGGLFDKDGGDPTKEIAFRFAIEKVNSESVDPASRVAGQVERVPVADSFHTGKRVCRLLQIGVAAVIGPGVEPTASHVQSICDTKSLPHIETRPDPWPYLRSATLNLHPHPPSLGEAYADILRAYRWAKFYVIYENNESLSRLQDILKIPDASADIVIIVRQLPESSRIRSLLRSIYNTGGTHMVVDCSPSRISSFLSHAQQLGMITRHYNYFFTSLDFHTIDLEPFQFAGTNISGLRLVDSSNLNVMATVDSWRSGELRDQPLHTTASTSSPAQFSAAKLSTASALIYDAVLLFARAVRDLHSSRDLAVTSLNCDLEDTWQHGDSLLNYMRMVEVNGLTGHVRFDPSGRRTQFQLDVLILTENGLEKSGHWRPSGVNISRAGANTHQQKPSIQSQNLVITILMKAPYTMLKESSEELTGNERFEGMCIDLVRELARALGFNYTLRPVADDAPGQFDPSTGRWNGMIGELLEGRADLAIADLTITSEREAVVDFTMQFMNLGISILYRKPTRQPPSLFSFLAPLSPYVWLYMAAATMGVSILMFVLARFTPYEWEPPHPCAADQDKLENNFDMPNCVWFCIGSLMQQGCDFLPKAISTRMVAGIWWFFTLIMISSYTANLAAFLTVERMVSPIESAEDLASQNKIKYGVYEKGSTAAFFRNSKLHPYDKMWRVMESSTPSVFMGSDDGIQRVKEDAGQYAYFMESSTIEYVVERECELTQIGGLLDNKGYGIALPPGSPYRDRFNAAILLLQEKGDLQKMYTRWWKERRLKDGVCEVYLEVGQNSDAIGMMTDSPWSNELNQQLVTMQEKGQLARLKTRWWKDDSIKCQDDSGGSLASALDLENVGGVFVCLLGGMIVATIMAVIEFIYHLRSDKTNANMPVLLSMWRELCAILKCRGSTKLRICSTEGTNAIDGTITMRERSNMPVSGVTVSSTVS